MNKDQRYQYLTLSQKIHAELRSKDLPPDRVEFCRRVKNKRASSVSVVKSPDGHAHFAGLQTCASVWACPVCSSIISERRFLEFEKDINIWRSKDACNTVLMITYTTPHYIFDTLDKVLELQDKAIRLMKKQAQTKNGYKTWSTIMDHVGYIGSFTARDTTFGFVNGWHPHRHECLFTVSLSDDELTELRHDLTIAFENAFIKAGGVINDVSAFRKRAVVVCQANDDAGYKQIAHYVTEIKGQDWSLAQEATKGVVKTSRHGNLTPFGILAAIKNGHSKSDLLKKKFYEYCQTMKGKRQFFASKGVRAWLGNNEILSDDEILQESENYNLLFCSIPDDVWEEILYLDVRAEVLSMAQEFKNGDDFLIELLRCFPKRAGGSF